MREKDICIHPSSFHVSPQAIFLSPPHHPSNKTWTLISPLLHYVWQIYCTEIMPNLLISTTGRKAMVLYKSVTKSALLPRHTFSKVPYFLIHFWATPTSNWLKSTRYVLLNYSVLAGILRMVGRVLKHAVGYKKSETILNTLECNDKVLHYKRASTIEAFSPVVSKHSDDKVNYKRALGIDT